MLVTVLAVEGSSMRNPGAHMAVAADGSYVGSLSGGCIEAAVVAEAREVLDAGRARCVRYGAGSPYIDIRLPCGGGLDVHFLPLSDTALVERACAALAARVPFTLDLPGGEGRCAEVSHVPNPKLLIVGHGAAPLSLARQAGAMAADVAILTPDTELFARAEEASYPVQLLGKTGDTHLLASDPWTAIIFLFHDHDWEGRLMARALQLPHFFIGAMGGRKAHAHRVETLRALGASAEGIASIQAPIGLFHSSRDPDTLALSTLAQVVLAYQQAFLMTPAVRLPVPA